MNWLRRLFSAEINIAVIVPREKKKPVRLDKHKVEVMVEYHKSGRKPKELAKIFDVSLTTVHKYIRENKNV